jgi:pantoate--beta-alanine ligase
MRELERNEIDSSATSTVNSVAELRDALAASRLSGASIGLVPTMGAFHEGHLSLMRRAREDCDVVVVSLFVNPSQFGDKEDLASYPREAERDIALASKVGVDFLFAPSHEEVYPPGFSTTIEVSGLGETLCGAPRSRGAGHFRGVATVVAKLLNMCQPDVAYFGAKDFQQALLVKRLVRDLDMPVRIEVCPTVRDQDGLALSSRNARLSDLERRRALSLKHALDAAERAIRSGVTASHEIVAVAWRELEVPGVEPEYVEVVSAKDLGPLEELGGEDVLVAIAARVGRARLIDSVVVESEAATATSTPVVQTG